MANNPLVCPWWFIWTFDNPLRRLIQDPGRILDGLISQGQTALDIGCGAGYFTLQLARLVGPGGTVIAADLQPQMLATTRRRAERAGLLPRIRLHQALPDRLGITGPVDFALAFWMVHEVRHREDFLREVAGLLRPEGRLLIAEPKLHVTASDFQWTVETACRAGLVRYAEPQIGFSRAALFQRGP